MSGDAAGAVDTFRVGLLLTERCNVACAHCWFGSGPGKTARMSLREALDHIDQAREIETVRWISFTGGEPFLLPRTLPRLVEHASALGFSTECVTNCFWAVTPTAAERTLRGLRDAGLDVIDVSADDFHQRHVPFERVRNCYEAAKSLRLKIVIMCAASRSGRLRIREVARLLGNDEIHIIGDVAPPASPRALAIETGFVPVGRGAEIPEDEWLIDGDADGPCRVALSDIAIDPSGRVLPCCSAAGLASMAVMGNAKLCRLKGIVEDAGGRRLFKILRAEGPIGLQRLVGQMRREIYVSRCHLCHEVLTDPRLGRVL
jgi:hypothetical protein